MALVPFVGQWIARFTHKTTWQPMSNGDVGLVQSGPNLPDKTVSIGGVFGAAGSVSIEGDNIDGARGIILKDVNGNPCTFTTSATVAISPAPAFMRPRVTAGDGTTSMQVIITETRAH